MTESFFDRLELELRAAAERPPRRLARRPRAAVRSPSPWWRRSRLRSSRWPSCSGAATTRAVREPAQARPKPRKPAREGAPRGRHRPGARCAGPWQLEIVRGEGLKDPETGEVYEPAGLPCLYVFLHDPARSDVSSGGGFCGTFRKTPGFTRLQHNVPSRKGREVLLFGRVPARAKKLLLTAEGHPHRVRPDQVAEAGPRRPCT